MNSKKPRYKDPSPRVRRVLEWATPDIRDMVFYICVDTKLATYQSPEYGSSYPGPQGLEVDNPYYGVTDEGGTKQHPDHELPSVRRFERHKLVFVTPDDERGWERWYYAADRWEQGAYNFEYQDSLSTQDGYPSYRRTYLVPRSDADSFSQTLNKGDADPDQEYNSGFTGFEYTGCQRTGTQDQKLDSHYVLVVRHFQLLCDKRSVSEHERYGPVTTVLSYTSNDSDVLPLVGDLIDGEYVIDASEQATGCDGVRRWSVSSVALPTQVSRDEMYHEEWCKIYTERWVDTTDNTTLPEIGSAHPTEVGMEVVKSSSRAIGQSNLREFSVTYAMIPTPPVYSERRDDKWCTVYTATFTERSDQPLPSVGSTFEGRIVIEAQAQDIGCGDLRKFTISTVESLPTAPVVVKRLHDEWCSLIEEEYQDLSARLEDPPSHGDPHPSESGYVVVDAMVSNSGCGALSKQKVVYAKIPTEKRTTTSTHPEWCKVSVDSYYDDTGDVDLPSQGQSYQGVGGGGNEVVVESKATPVGCGSLTRYDITYASLPTAEVRQAKKNQDFCTTYTYTNYDLAPGTLSLSTPDLGDRWRDDEYVIDHSLQAVGCSNVMKYVTTTAVLPTVMSVDKQSHPDYCQLYTATFFDLNDELTPIGGAFDLGDPDLTGLFVVDSRADAVGCGLLTKKVYQLAQLPSTPQVAQATHDLFCNVESLTWVCLEADVPPLERGTEDPTGYDESKYVIDYQFTPLACGTLVKVSMTLGNLPSEQLTGSKLNEVDGTLARYKRYVVPEDQYEDEISPVDEDGVYRVAEPYGCGMKVVSEADIRPFIEREHFTTTTYRFPPVISSIDFFVWERQAGGEDIYPQIEWKRYAYSGPVATRIVERWHHEPPEPQEILILQPTPLVYACPLFTINTGPCLHDEAQFVCNFGTGHPTYKLAVGSELNFPATEHLDWPTEEFLAGWTVSPSYGGYVERETWITPPSWFADYSVYS